MFKFEPRPISWVEGFQDQPVDIEMRCRERSIGSEKPITNLLMRDRIGSSRFDRGLV
jgi:hypothetical protein